MKSEILQEEEYFDKYYPSELGDWRKEYNIRGFVDGKCPGVCWMCYKRTGFVLSDSKNTGKMKVCQWSSPIYIESFFLSGAGSYLCPYKTGDEKLWGHVTLRKMESNLDIYIVKVEGCDDSSYTMHCLGKTQATMTLGRLIMNGIEDMSFLMGLGFFFSN